ncbi:MAG: autotransporter outer membrane beta-barrel domain-containing protein [Rhodanobacter sp.]
MTHLLDLPGSSVRSRGSVPLAAQQSQGDEQGWRVWGRDFGGSSRTPARQSAGPGELSVADHGMAIGFDYRNEPGTMFGVGLAKAATRFTTGSGTMGNSDDHQFGVYGTTQVGSFYLAGAASTGRFDYATTRTLSLIGASHKAWFRATSWGARMETGVRLDTASLGITPYVAMQFANFVTPAFDEAPDQHAPVAALRFLRRSTDNYRMEEGVAFERMFDLRGPRSLAISLRAAWVHQWSSNPDLGAAFEAAEFSSFRVGGEPPVKDLALLSAGADMRLTGNLSIGARFDGQFGSRARHYSGLATLGYRW